MSATAGRLWADYMRLKRNLQRLAQLEDIQFHRWERHEQECPKCGREEYWRCRTGTELLTRAQTLAAAVGTIKGEIIWQ